MDTINPSIFKGYDIRGIYPTDLNEKNIVSIIQAIFAFFKKERKGNDQMTLVVGTDMRTSSPSLTKVAIETLMQLGANVVDVGVVSTPTFYFAVSHYGYEAGIQITASHNPKEWNGIKIVRKGDHGLIKIGKSTGLEEIKQMAVSGMRPETSDLPKSGTMVTKTGVKEDEVDNALKIVADPTIKSFKIVADAANAMGSEYIDALFKKIPGKLIKMNFTLDGTFPAHQPDPLQAKNLVDLKKKVLQEHADLGLAPDGDGDRLFFIDEKGETVPPTIITSMVAKELLTKHPGEQILIDVRYILTPQKIVAENGGTTKITKVGHAYITEAMNQTGGIFAGESSGHYFFRETGNAESQVPMILTILSILTREGKPFSAVVEEYRRSFESGEFNFEVSNANEIMKKAKEHYKEGEVETMDGVAVSFAEWRFSLRSSNTEPLLRLNVESYKKDVMEQKRDELMAFVKQNSQS